MIYHYMMCQCFFSMFCTKKWKRTTIPCKEMYLNYFCQMIRKRAWSGQQLALYCNAALCTCDENVFVKYL